MKIMVAGGKSSRSGGLRLELGGGACVLFKQKLVFEFFHSF